MSLRRFTMENVWVLYLAMFCCGSMFIAAIVLTAACMVSSKFSQEQQADDEQKHAANPSDPEL